jgi:hypothetical protein
MQPQQPQSPEEWQAPTEAGSQAPYQAVAPEGGSVAVNQPTSTTQDTREGASSLEAGVTGVQTDSLDERELQDDDVLVRWQSAEYLHQDQTPLWYGILAVVTVVLMALAYLLIRSLTFTLLIPVMAATLVIYTRRPPAVIDYTLSRKGLYINDKLYPYEQFRSFSVVSHNGAHSVVLVPRKRFQIAQTVYFSEQVGEQLVDMLAARLPMKQGAPDMIDRLLAKLRL